MIVAIAIKLCGEKLAGLSQAISLIANCTRREKDCKHEKAEYIPLNANACITRARRFRWNEAKNGARQRSVKMIYFRLDFDSTPSLRHPPFWDTGLQRWLGWTLRRWPMAKHFNLTEWRGRLMTASAIFLGVTVMREYIGQLSRLCWNVCLYAPDVFADNHKPFRCCACSKQQCALIREHLGFRKCFYWYVEFAYSVGASFGGGKSTHTKKKKLLH